MTDWMDDQANYIIPIMLDAKQEFPQGGMKVMECPKCKDKLTLVVSSYNQHCHGNCKTEGCLNWME